MALNKDVGKIMLLLATLYTTSQGTGYNSHGGYGSNGHVGYGYGQHLGYGLGGYGQAYGGFNPGYNSIGYGGYGNTGYGSGFGGYRPHGYGHGGFGHGYGLPGLGSYGGYDDEPYGSGGYDDEEESTDVIDEPTPTVCLMPKKAGTCKGTQIKYAFDVAAAKCKGFIYTGCGGNDNRFDSIESCKAFCKPEPEKLENDKKSKKKKHGKRFNPFRRHYLAKRHQIDRYLAQSHHLGQQRLNVQVDYLNTPLGYQYLNQHHGLSHPLSHTPFASRYGLSG